MYPINYVSSLNVEYIYWNISPLESTFNHHPMAPQVSDQDASSARRARELKEAQQKRLEDGNDGNGAFHGNLTKNAELVVSHGEFGGIVGCFMGTNQL